MAKEGAKLKSATEVVSRPRSYYYTDISHLSVCLFYSSSYPKLLWHMNSYARCLTVNEKLLNSPEELQTNAKHVNSNGHAMEIAK